ncbi:MAG: hypothetical protein GXY34_02945 [Syntrophomonadaceae bacterium]|nr:hypothetical protein [Syntrophomonadaceae bacterium]
MAGRDSQQFSFTDQSQSNTLTRRQRGHNEEHAGAELDIHPVQLRHALGAGFCLEVHAI